MPGNLQGALSELSANPVKKGDSAALAAASWRIQALTDAVFALSRGDNIGKGLNVRKRSSEGGIILSSDGQNVNRGGFSLHPFRVLPAGRNGILGVSILPGLVAGLIPFVLDDVLGNVQLNHLPERPILDLPAGAGVKPILIRCDMTSPGPDIFQGMVITAATMQSSYAPDAAPDPEPAGGGYKIFWDDTPTPPAPHLIGHFYVKVANVTVLTVGSSTAVGAIGQLVNTNLPTFVLAGEDLVIVMPLI